MKKLHFFLICLWAISYSHATIINVPADQPTIQAGINVAINGDTVLGQPGIYYENINFNGKGITVASLFLITQDTGFISQTIISGESGGGCKVTFDSGEDTTSILSGFLIGNSGGSGIQCTSSGPALHNLIITNNSNYSGAGIYCDNSSPVITDLLIANNQAYTWVPSYARGGGIACFNSSNPTLTHVIIKNNYAVNGGGVYFENSGAILHNVWVTNNNGFYSGGGIYCTFSNIVMQDVFVEGNSCNQSGGGIYLDNSISLLQNVVIENNTAGWWGWHGGGIFCINSNPVLMGAAITNNSAYFGGGVFMDCSNPAMSGVTITNNTANSGGGVFLDCSSPDLENVIITDNSATSGGGMFLNESVPVLHSVTLASNLASADGGGMFCTSSVPVFDSINRSNIFYNVAVHGNDLYSDTILQVVVDTFTVLYPTSYHAFPIENYSFDILNGKLQQVEADLYVSPNGDNANSGLSLNDPLKNVYVALLKMFADSLHPHTIHLLEGTYSPGTNEEIFPVFIPDYISLDGISDTGVILDAEGQSYSLLIDGNSYRQIRDLTVSGGNTAGISITNSDPALHNLIVTNNAGYGIYCSNANPEIENVTITNNTSSGFYCDHSSPELLNVKIMNNISPSNGGGMLISWQSHPVLHDVTIAHNSAAGSGGGIYCDYAIPIFDSINRCDIFLNNAYRANDVYSDYYIKVVVDTFTVLFPTEYHVEHFNLFNFDVLNGKLEQIDADLYVSPEGDNTNSGFTPVDPLKTIRFAFSKIMTNSQNQNAIHLLEGTYSPAANGEIFPLYMPDYYMLCGVSDTTVILDAEAQSGVMIFDYNTGTTVTGLTIKGGSAEKGGGIYFHYSDPSLQNLIVSENSAQYGGGLCCEFAVPQIQDVNIVNNTASSGGGIYCANSNPTLQGVTLTGNYASLGGAICFSNSIADVQNSSIFNNTADQGGGIYCSNASPEFINVFLSGNTASANGGAIYIVHSYPYFQGLEITGNMATGYGSRGGGIYIDDSNPVFEGLIVTGNSAAYGGGGIYSYDTWLELMDAAITGNSASKGGGIYIDQNPNAIIQNVTVKGNSATDEGGGFYCADSEPYLENVIISNNHAIGNASMGGGIYCSSSNIEFHNTNRCNIYFNDAFQGREIYSETMMEVVVDTFTVLYPNSYYVLPTDNFTFDILHGKIEQVDADLYISPSGDNTNSGLTADDPLKTIRYANSIILADSLHQHAYFLLEGTYSPLTSEDPFPLNVVDYISVVGESENDVIIDGENITTLIEYYDNHLSSISNVTMINGNPHGIYSQNSILEIKNIFISANSNCGIYAENSSLGIENATVTQNNGHGIYGYGGDSLFLTNAHISGNGGRGVFMYNFSNSKITESIIEDNSEGGIHCSFSSPVISDVILRNNSASDGSGLYCSNDSDPLLINVFLTGNSASGMGGGLYCNYNSDPYLVNTQITSNTANDKGGGMACWGSSYPTLINVTLANNISNELGGAIYCYASSNPVIVNSILWNDSPQEIIAPYIEVTYCVILGGWEGEGNIDVDPLFVGIGDYPFALSDNSPCINAGNPDTTGLNLPEFDLAGNLRFRGGRIDMGAYENQNVSTYVSQNLPVGDFEFLCTPNPFSDELTITYVLTESARTKIEIYNSTGKKVNEYSDKLQSEGRQVCQIKMQDLPAGVYFCIFKNNERIQMIKIVKI